MGAIASQITSLTIVYSTVYSGADQRKHQSTSLCEENSPGTGEFPAQMASNAENVSIWWRHHVIVYSPSDWYWAPHDKLVWTVMMLLSIDLLNKRSIDNKQHHCPIKCLWYIYIHTYIYIYIYTAYNLKCIKVSKRSESRAWVNHYIPNMLGHLRF